MADDCVVLQQLAHPTPTAMFTFPSQASTDSAAPSLSVFSPGGTSKPALTPPAANLQASPLSPSRGYCPVVRGLTPLTTTSSAGLGGGGGSLTAPSVGAAPARSPSVNRLGSLFNSINRSVTSAFSNFVAVNQPVPGVIQDYEQSMPTPPIQRQQSLPVYQTQSRRSSANQETTSSSTMQTLTTTSVPRSCWSLVGGSAAPGRPGGQLLSRAVATAPSIDEQPESRAANNRARPSPPPPQPSQPLPGPRRPRTGLPIHDTPNPTQSYTDLPNSHHNLSLRGTWLVLLW